MQIILTGTGKKFNTEWIFRNLSFTFEKNNPCAVLGRNGSGKSTLLQVISGKIQPTSGKVTYLLNDREINDQEIYRYITLCAPYLELIEDFTLDEMLRFHFSFKKMLPGFTRSLINDILDLNTTGKKPIRLFSSGMKQRVKLVLAILSDAPVVLLDEPTTNLDQAGMDWYSSLVNRFSSDRILVICSNHQDAETSFCTKKLLISDFKN
jgi:ABC-type multidrug transport system ATPase subunit